MIPSQATLVVASNGQSSIAIAVGGCIQAGGVLNVSVNFSALSQGPNSIPIFNATTLCSGSRFDSINVVNSGPGHSVTACDASMIASKDSIILEFDLGSVCTGELVGHAIARCPSIDFVLVCLLARI